jgi:hypothetical protein
VRRWYSETLASRKVVYREVCTEGIRQLAENSGTDGQELDMRLDKPDEQAQLVPGIGIIVTSESPQGSVLIK